MDLLTTSFDGLDGKLERRNSDSESYVGKRTVSNASNCSRSGRGKRTQSRLLAQEDKDTRARTSSRHSATSSSATPTKERQNSLESSGVESDVSESVGSPVKQEEIIKAQAFEKLRQELERAQLELRKRDDECFKLSQVRDNLEGEVEELTASLFEEAHNMVREANIKQANAEMKYKEAQMKLEGLQAEVSALKVLVITSTPSNPGKKQHRRFPSADQICAECGACHSVSEDGNGNDEGGEWCGIDMIDKREVDPMTFHDFLSWLQKRCPCEDHPFITRVLQQDVRPCLGFPNQELAGKVHAAVKSNTLIVESVSGAPKPRVCNLTKTTVPCPYKISFGEDNNSHFISEGCRARIVAVADFYTYIRYINQGLLKKEANTIYWDIMKKRAEMALARLGLVKKKK